MQIPSEQQQSFLFHNVHIYPHEQIGLHHWPSWEVSYVLFGSGLRTIGDTTEPFQAGEVVMIPPNMPHCWRFSAEDTNEEGKIANISLSFDYRFLNNCSAAFPELRPAIERLSREVKAIKFANEKAAAIAATLRAMCAMQPSERIAPMIHLLLLVSDTSSAHVVGQSRSKTSEEERWEKIQVYISCNLNKEISIQDIALHLGMNRSAFCAYFKQATGQTFVTYLNAYRIDMACQLLRKGQQSISDISYAVGFNNIPYFNRVFKKQLGITPTQFLSERGL